jgi:hypothetical protein
MRCQAMISEGLAKKKKTSSTETKKKFYSTKNMLFGKLEKKVRVRAPTQKHTPGAVQKWV